MTSSPNVLLLTDADVFAGTESHILALATALRAEQIGASIGCPDPSPLAQRARAAGISVIPIPKRGRIDWQATRQIKQLTQGGEFQIIHAHNGRTALAAAIGLRVVKQARLVVTQHFLDPAHTRRRGAAALLSKIIHHKINARADRFIAISHAVADSMRRREPHVAPRVIVIHNGIAPIDPVSLRPRAQVRAELGIDAQSPLIVCAARLEKEKDVGSLIAAMNIVRQRCPAARCVIAGRGSLQDELSRQIEALSLWDNVRLLGFRADATSLIHAADCFVLPSLAEPFGLVLLEAMSLGKPVIATRAGGCVEIVDDHDTGLLVGPSDPAAMAVAIEQIIQAPPAAIAMGERGRERFLSLFTDHRMATSTADVYRQLLGAASNSAKSLSPSHAIA
jgi:glycosyltransferase involved in cell wall biosynthesis